MTTTLMAADTVNHLFLAWNPVSQNIFNSDYNTTGALYVYDENGNLLKTITGWSFADLGDLNDSAQNYLQANGHSRKAFLMKGGQLAVIDY